MKKGERERERGRRENVSVCVCVCVCERVKEREKGIGDPSVRMHGRVCVSRRVAYMHDCTRAFLSISTRISVLSYDDRRLFLNFRNLAVPQERASVSTIGCQ